MGIDTVLEIINTYPAMYFIVGLVMGYFLRGLVSNRFVSIFGNKKPGRYQSIKTDTSVKRSTVISDLQEPPFDLPDAVVKSLTPQRVGGIIFDQPNNEV
jgi:hypothetical protein